MAEKLSESAWTAFARKRQLEDAPLVKALARYDKTGEAQHEARIAALDDIVTQAKKQVLLLAKRTKELGDKEAREVKDRLYELLDEAERQLKTTHAAREKAQDEADEEADAPVLLTTKMIPLLRELRRGEARMHALIGTAGKNTAVLILRRSIAPTRRKLLAEALDAQGGAKYIPGECLWEEGALTFIVQSKAAGLAKRVRKALLEQTEMRLKVRVRGDDGEQDEDAEDGEDGEDGAHPEAQPDATQANAGAMAWARRLPGIREQLAVALRGNHPEATKLRALIGFAGEKVSTQQDYAAGLAALDRIEGLLKSGASGSASASASASASTPEARPGTATATAPPTEPSAATRQHPVAAAIVYTQTRLAWVATRNKVRAELGRLETAILDRYKGRAVLPEVVKSVRKLDEVLTLFDESLVDKLDGALQTADPQEKSRWHDEARAVIARYQGFLASDPLVRELDGNPFVPVAVQATLSKTLETLASKIV